MAEERVDVFTDGACSGNPGPGGWAWAVANGPRGSGGEETTTNQRMELQAALEALRALEGEVTVHSDSTYVVNCFVDKWYEGWLRRDWRNSQRKPVANRDLWEPLIDLYLSRQHEIEFQWVKGHSGDEMNDLVDAMAVEEAAKFKPSPSAETGSSPSAETGSSPSAETGSSPVGPVAPWPIDRAIAVTGVREMDDEQREALTEAIAGLDPGYDILVSGLRRGTELDGAELAVTHGVPLAVVLPYPDPASRWPRQTLARFQGCTSAAKWTVTLEGDPGTPSVSVKRRDAWMWTSVVGVIVVGDQAAANNLDEQGLGVIEIP